MNGLTHFAFGFFIARYLLKRRNGSFSVLLVSIGALIPDIDSFIGIFIPFEHGVFTHTIIGGLLFTSIYAASIWGIGCSFLRENGYSFAVVLGLASLGMVSHLFLDSFTYYVSYQVDGAHHMYFWPIWDFPVHINTIFPGATYQIRVLVEVLVSVALGVIILIYGWIIKKENPFSMFNANNWFSNEILLQEQDVRIQGISLMILNLIILVMLIITYLI